MGYDPIRDRVMPSPLEQSRQQPTTWPGNGSPADQIRQSTTYPPAFQSPTERRSTPGGIRSLLLNDEDQDPRKSARSSFSSMDGHQEPPSHARSIHTLLNSTPLAPPVSHSSSASSHRTSSPSNHSPSHAMHHSVYLTPHTPMGERPDYFAVPDQPGPSRRSMTMDPYPSAPYSLLHRSPSASVSPRGQHQLLPGSWNSRPNSATSSNHTFAYQSPGPVDSPARMSRILSEDFSRPNSSSTAPPARRETTPAYMPTSYSPSRPPIPTPRQPSPPRALPYNPKRISEPTTLSIPITREEVARLRAQAFENNPLRRRKRRDPPSWSGPSPSAARQPVENTDSYFPPQTSGQNATPAQTDPRPKHKRSSTSEADGHDTSRRKVSGTQYVGNAANVAEHYNSRPEVGVQNRELSPIIGLKKFNNWIKSVLIGLFSHRPPAGSRAKVLDIGCGKGGDLNKWKQARIQLYVGMDIASMSIQQARDRYLTMHRPGFDAHFFAHDCYSKSITEVLPEQLCQKDMYDNVSMQFCMHYAFESASKARMMIENVSRYLRPGGRFIGTVPDSDLLLSRLADIPEGEPLRFGNECYAVQFTERKHKGLYGHSYHFYLEDAVDDVPEYIVNWDNFVALASEYRLRLIYKKSFNDVLQEEKDSRDFGPLLTKMGVIHPDGSSQMDDQQWEAANLYMAFAFEKQ